MSKQRLLASLPAHASPGRTRYAPPGAACIPPAWLTADDLDRFENAASVATNGSVLFETDDSATVVVPPFNVDEPAQFDIIQTQPLVDLLDRPRAFAALLLRRGGYTVGFFRGDYIVASKTGQRFVKNRHRKGGQSQRRFDRIRDKQVLELLRKCCADARATLDPYIAEIQHLFLGGDRLILKELRADCDYFDRTFGGRISERLLSVAGDPRRASLDAVPREVWSSDVYIFERETPSLRDAPEAG